MEGYGEFIWTDGKKYAGFYKNDKKEGFGIYYWTNPRKVYLGFWKNGKQDGVGKYINQEGARFGIWENGRKIKSLKLEQDAMDALEGEAVKYGKLLKLDVNEITAFLEKI